MKIFVIFLLFYGVYGEKFNELSPSCGIQYEFFRSSLSNRRQWAVELYDTWGKFQHGILNGNTFNFGDYDRCVDFTYDIVISNVGRIQGKYFLITLAVNRNRNESSSIKMDFSLKEAESMSQNEHLTLTSGMCLPNSCNNNDGQIISKAIFSKFNFNVTSTESRSDKDTIQFRVRIMAVVIFSFLLLTVILSTFYEIAMIHREKEPSRMLTSFSIFANGKSLFATTKCENTRSIECLNGLRALSLLWIIFGHRYFDIFMAPADNTTSATLKWLANLLSLSHTTFHLAVDTFFLMGGLLATMSYMRSFDVRNFNILKIYFHRFLRYTPVLLFLLLFFVTFIRFLGSGPIFDQTLDAWLPNCQKYWWSTLLHISTYTNIDELCMNWTWYLAADYQLFLISPLLVYPAWRWRWRFFVIFPLVILLSQIYIFVVSYINEFLVFVGPLQTIGQHDYDKLLYYPTHGRCGSWLVGMTLGFVMYEYRDRGLRVNKHLSRFLWFTSITMILVIVLVYFQFQQADQYLEFSNIENSLYNAFYRHLWALSIGWIIIGCHNGSGGVIKWFLSHSCFQPIAKMSLSIYLTHRVHQIISIASIRQSIHLNPYEIFQIYLSDVMMSLAIGTVVYLTIEAPFANLESRIFNRRPRK